ncbi:hypothetical protein IJ670_04030 [bacterium]|nr:hypothetical protein [bacterium]
MKISVIKILIICLVFSLSVCFAQDNQIDAQLSKIETSLWGFEYSKDDVQKRLARLENNVFGAPSTTLKTQERIKKLNESMGFESYEDSTKEAYEIDTREAQDINYPQIDALEYQLFKGTYNKENIYKRLERLEKKIFGSIQEGDLMTRTRRLKAYVKQDVVAQDTTHYTQQPYRPTENIQPYSGSQDRYDNSDIHIQIAGLESAMFSKTYSQDPVGLRLNRLERKIFQRDFSSDDESTRIQRLQAAANAQQTAKLYEANKIQKYTSTGIQLGSIILMILALIL